MSQDFVGALPRALTRVPLRMHVLLYLIIKGLSSGHGEHFADALTSFMKAYEEPKPAMTLGPDPTLDMSSILGARPVERKLDIGDLPSTEITSLRLVARS